MKQRLKKVLYGSLIILGVAICSYAGQMEKNPSLAITTLPENVTIFQLDNGLQVLLIKNQALPMTGVNVVVKTGSAYENFSTSGMSHMLEHLLFNGTSTRTQKELYDAVDLIGGYNNANTGQYYTNYMMVTPAEHIRTGMVLQADMLFNSVIPEDKFKKEKGIVLEEIARSLENSDEQLTRNEQDILYAGHALSLPTLGTYATIEAMNRDAVYAYYKNAYVPNNMIMSVVGQFQSDSMRIWINKLYGKAVPEMVRYPENPNWVIGFEKKMRESIDRNIEYHRFYGGEKIVLQLYYELPQFWHDVHFVIMEEILSKERSRIVNLLKEKYPDIEQSIKFETLYTPVINYLNVSFTQDERNKLGQFSNDITQILWETDFNLPVASLDYLSTKSKTSFFQNIEKPHMFGIYNAHVFAERGIEGVLSSYARPAFQQAADDISEFKINQRPLILIQSPVKKIKASETNQVKEAEKSVDANNGMILIAEQNASSDLLAVHFLLKYKAQFDARYGKDAAKILHDCLAERLNSIENQKISNQYGLTYTVNDNPYIPMDNIYLDPDFGYIRVEGLADDISGVIGYLKSQIGGFVPTIEEYQTALSKTKMPMMGMGSSQSSMIFENAWEEQVYEDKKYQANTQVVSYDNLAKMAALYFHPSNMIISVVSPAPGEKVFAAFDWQLPIAAQTDFPTKEAYTRQLKIPEAEARTENSAGGERSYLFWGFVKRIDENDRAALQVLGLMLSDHIVFEIREKQGRAYRMKAGIDLVADKALFNINLGTRSENIDPIIEQAPGFYNKITVDSFTEFDLKKSLNMYLGRMMFRRLSSINRAYYLGHSEYFHGDITYDARFLNKLKKVTLADIQNAAEKYLVNINSVEVIVR